MSPSVLIQAWQMAAQDLGIDIVSPYALKMKSGEEVQADVLVTDFGPILVATEASGETFRRLGDQIAAEGYGWSLLCGEELTYDREHFIEILNDWGWAGPGDRRPEWCKQTRNGFEV